MPSRSIASRLTEWMATVVSLLIVALVSWIATNTWEVHGDIVSLKERVTAMEKTLDRIENNTAPHDGRMAVGTK